jgi:NAD-dependent histone deacetylase SIR2
LLTFLVPDFRSSNGLFKALKKEHNLKSSGKDLFDASTCYKDEASIASFHEMVRAMSKMTKSAKPTPFHHMLASLADEGRLLRLYTQNVDGIDTAMAPLKTVVPLNDKGPWPRTVQLHGGLQKMVCSKCHEMSDLKADLFNGPIPPTCRMCEAADNARTEHAGKRSHGIGRLRPRMVLYNEYNPDDEAIGRVVAADLRTRPDALIVVGTTLKVPGVKRIVKEMCGVVRGRRDGLTVWINTDAPPLSKDYEWDLIVTGKCDRVAEHADMPRWDGPRPIPATDGEGAAMSCVFIPAAPKEAEPASGAPPSPRSTRASSRPVSPTKPKPAKPITLKFRLDKDSKAKPKPKTGKAAASAKAPGGVRKPRAPKKTKKEGVSSRGTISFPASKAAAVLAEAGKKLAKGAKTVKGAKDTKNAKDVKDEPQPSPSLSVEVKEPMHPLSPTDLNAAALVAAPTDKDNAPPMEFVKGSSLSPVSEQRRGYTVDQLCN